MGTGDIRCFAMVEFAEAFPDRLDHELRKNPHYALCRDLGQLAPLQCSSVPGGAYFRAGMEAGQRIGDIKPRALSSRTDLRSAVFAGGK